MISIIVPSFNESDSLRELVERINSVDALLKQQFEIILVDDGSNDNSWEVMQDLASQLDSDDSADHVSHSDASIADHHCQAIRLRRNFGKAAALSAGIDHARGDVLITMDADLQDEPAEIPRLLDKLHEGFDVVSGWKENRRDPIGKTAPSKVFNWMVNKVTGLQLKDHNCGFKAYRAEVFREVRLYGEMHRFVPALAASRGFRVAQVAVEHHARKHGHSKYGVERIVKGFLDLLTVFFLTGYGQRPQHLLGTGGLISGGLGTATLIVLTLRWVFERMLGAETPIELHSRAIFYYAILGILLGVQLLSMGFLAELITLHASRSAPIYSIRDQAGKMTEQDISAVNPRTDNN